FARADLLSGGMFQRYAVFFTPPPGDLEAAGRSWLGWCSRLGVCVPQPDVPGLEIQALTRRASRYGFHATLVAPFFPADGVTESDLQAETRCLAQLAQGVMLPPLDLSDQHGFFAFRPARPHEGLMSFAAQCVRRLHPLRALPSEQELARRRRARLSPRQEGYLMRWGYPYVMEDFNFHMTLTGRVNPDTQSRVRAAISAHFQDACIDAVPLGAVTLMGEAADGRFHQISR
ncbi:MAG: DUF1045 domain-containing protein, partial [Pseudomonadota bacterium]